MRFSTTRIARFALIAGIAALIGWIIVEPMNRAQERVKIDIVREMVRDLPGEIEGLTRPDGSNDPSNVFRSLKRAGEMVDRLRKKQDERMRKAAGNPYINTGVVMMFVGMMLGAGLSLADELSSLSFKRIGFKALVGAAVGAAGGFLAGVVAQFIFSILSGGFGLLTLFLVFARALAWAVAGMAIGASVGAAGGSKNLAFQGMIGGMLGGGFGGLFFDAISSIGQAPDILFSSGYHYATAGRLFAGTLMGACIGAAVAMIQEVAKQAWVTVLAGRNEGKDYILTKHLTSIGKDELADIPLFGDRNVEKRHAVIEEHLGTHVLNASGPVSINNQPVNQARLQNGDLIAIGCFTLRFTTRSVKAFASASSATSYQPYSQPQVYNPAIPTTSYAPGTHVVPKLRAFGGLLNGAVFDIPSCRVSVGRDPSNDISLAQDTSVSRRHAEITYENGQYMLRDVGSSNGTYVNGSRILEASITPVDVIQIGATQFCLTFEPPS